ncbi:MAG: hypothetical protein ACLFWF_14205, partial [Alphaproteobacteria bacterium]
MAAARSGDFVYAQPRLQARHAAMPGPFLWQEMEQTADFGQFLQSVRTTALGSAVDGFGAASSIDDMEIELRRVFAARIDEMAAWLPEAWQPAMQFVRTLVWLPFYGQGGAPDAPDWMPDDPELAARGGRENEEEEGDERRAASGLDTDGWLGRWRALWPHDAPGLMEIGRQLVAAALPDRDGEESWPERRAGLAERLTRA